MRKHSNPRPAGAVRPGDVVADCGGEAHEVIAVERPDRTTVIVHADEDLAIVTQADHELTVVEQPLPGFGVAADPLAATTRPDGDVALAESQRLATYQGKVFDEQCRTTLKRAGFDVSGKPFRVPQLGIEVDAEGKAPNGVVFWFQFKGSWLGTRPGARRTDTMMKALAMAFTPWADERTWPPVVLITSHLPAPGSGGAKMLGIALGCGALHAVVELYSAGSEGKLRALANTVPFLT